MLFLRMKSEHQTQRMPPLARNVIDQTALKMMEEWIKSIDAQGKPKAKVEPKPESKTSAEADTKP